MSEVHRRLRPILVALLIAVALAAVSVATNGVPHMMGKQQSAASPSQTSCPLAAVCTPSTPHPQSGALAIAEVTLLGAAISLGTLVDRPRRRRDAQAPLPQAFRPSISRPPRQTVRFA